MINPKNENDNECYKWAFIAGMHYKDIKINIQRIDNLIPYEKLYNFSMLTYPVSIDQITEFEIKNNVAINLYKVSKNNDSINLNYVHK